MIQLPRAPVVLPTEIDAPIRSLAEAWARSTIRPRVDPSVLAHWDRLIDSWIGDYSLPLYIRKIRQDFPRGSVVYHKSGRELVPCDNSPAHWSFMLAFAGNCPALAEVKAEMAADRIPVMMALARADKPTARYKCCRGSLGNPNDYGWKVCHAKPVALGTRGPLAEVPIEAINRHFRDFISPSNMFLVPKALSGLGELPHFTELFAKVGELS